MTTFRVWARPRPTGHQTRWTMQGGPVEGSTLAAAAAQASRWQELYPDHELAILPAHGSSPCTTADLARLAGLEALQR